MTVKSTMKYALILLAGFLICSCSESVIFSYQDDADIQALQQAPPVPYPDVSFILLSDTHYYDSSLGTEGEAFEDYLAHDRKLLEESSELFETAAGMMAEENSNIVLISGDLTKDGEKSGHLSVAELLKNLEQSGKQVFVVPGNHDINSGDAVRFEGDTTEPVPTVTPEEFASIYREFGYSEALFRDENSLSYVVEPVEGLWILGLDSCKYRENDLNSAPIVAGKFYDPVKAWIEGILVQALEQKKAVLVFMHHGVVEHWPGQEKFYPDYLLEQYGEYAEMFARYNVRLAFTGHYHSHDIAVQSFEDKFLFDVETGSFLTNPNPYRICTIKDNKAAITSRYITSIPSHPSGFREFSKQYTYDGIYGIAYETVLEFKAKPFAADYIADAAAESYVVHYQGDEVTEERSPVIKKGLGLMGRVVLLAQGGILDGLWVDSPGADRAIRIDLDSGDSENQENN